ncbi:MAG: hypothetical protein ABIU05_27485, partial [Nitrospirales bacterium]
QYCFAATGASDRQPVRGGILTSTIAVASSARQDAEKVRHRRSRIVQTLNVQERACRMSESLEGLFRSPGPM